MSDLETKLLKHLYQRYKNTNQRQAWPTAEAFVALGIKDGTDLSTLHDSQYLSIVGETFVISTEGIRYMDNLLPLWKSLVKKYWVLLLGLLAIIILLFLGYKLSSIQIGPFGFTPSSKQVGVTSSIQNDAKQVADSIVITGWEDPGDYIGDLSKITTFYSKYKDSYPVEFQTYSRQLTEWQDKIKKKTDAGETIWAADENGLMGLVRSGDNHLEEIANNNNEFEGE